MDFDIGVGEAVEATGLPVEADVEALLMPGGYEGRLQALRALQEREQP